MTSGCARSLLEGDRAGDDVEMAARTRFLAHILVPLAEEGRGRAGAVPLQPDEMGLRRQGHDGQRRGQYDFSEHDLSLV